MNYTDFVNRVSTFTLNNTSDASFITYLPAAIDYAEQRIYRELNLASNSVRNSQYSTSVNGHVLTLPTSQFVTITNINVITPTGTSSPDAGTRTALTPVNWDYIDAVYNSSATAGVPQYFALQDAATIAFGPWPNAAYPLEIIGTARPTPLSVTNPTTWLASYLPDLFFSAAMVFMSGAMRNFGAQVDDPQMGMTWEVQTTKLMASAAAEEARKRLGGI